MDLSLNHPLSPELQSALEKAAADLESYGVPRDELLLAILTDWLIAHGYHQFDDDTPLFPSCAE